jgi:enoyl-[acyl-carrier protein] reductase I
MGILEGKKLVVTGVLTDASIAFTVARIAQEQGAELVLTSFGRPMRITERVAKRLPDPPDVLELDVTNPDHVPALSGELERRWGRLDGVVHAIGFAPETCLGGDILRAGWDDVATAVQVSAYSLRVLADVALPLMEKAGGV